MVRAGFSRSISDGKRQPTYQGLYAIPMCAIASVFALFAPKAGRGFKNQQRRQIGPRAIISRLPKTLLHSGITKPA